MSAFTRVFFDALWRPSLEGRRPRYHGCHPSRLARCARSHLRMTTYICAPYRKYRSLMHGPSSE
jgi:hypothetical protein